MTTEASTNPVSSPPGIWDVESGQRILDLRKSGRVRDMLAEAFSRDARRIVVAYADRIARILDAGTGEIVQTLDNQIRAFLLERGVAVRRSCASCARNCRSSSPAAPTCYPK
jgi:hypothetical protein